MYDPWSNRMKLSNLGPGLKDQTLSNRFKFECQIPLCRYLYPPYPKACWGSGALCSTDLNSQASLPELCHSLPVKGTDCGIQAFPSTINLAPDHTLFCVLGHLFLSVMRDRLISSPSQLPFPPTSLSYKCLGYPRKSCL